MPLGGTMKTIDLQFKKSGLYIGCSISLRDALWHFSGPVENSRRYALFEISIVRADVYNAVQVVVGPVFIIFSRVRRPTPVVADR